ncbi:MAG: Maf family protein [Planctomycetota bacterium]
MTTSTQEPDGTPTENPRDPLVLLASRSPRRRELLDRHGYRYEVVDADVDDGDLAPGTGTPEEWVVGLAYLKARAGVDAWTDDPRSLDCSEGIVLGADTVCVKNGEIIGQPRDLEHAREILRTLRDGEHTVLTGVALLCPTQKLPRTLFVDRATVRVGHVTDAQIESYLATGAWVGKAGAYNLFERIEDGWPIEYDADPTSIMGLPMQRLAEVLRGA